MKTHDAHLAAPRTPRGARLLAPCLALCLLLGSLLSEGAHGAQSAAQQLHKLFDEAWEASMARDPIFATFVGDARYADRWPDLSPRAIRAEFAEEDAVLRRAQAIDPRSLNATDRVSRAVFIESFRNRQALRRFYADLPLREPTPVTPMRGPQFFGELVRVTRLLSVSDYEAYLKRLQTLPQFLAQLTEQLRLGAAHGWTPPRVTLARVPDQLASQVVADPTASALYAPFKSFPADIAPAEQERLRRAGEAAIRDDAVPAFRAFKNFFENEYLPRTRQEIAASKLPGGRAYYDALLREETTTALTAQQIHALGLKEVERIEAEMDAVIERTGFKGTRAQFSEHLWSDPKFFYKSPEQMLMALRDIAKRADAEMPKLFRELPRMPYGIRAMLPEQGDNAEHYMPGSKEGARAGYFEANTNNLSRRPTWQMPSLLLHEAVPGHHMQTARAQELVALPKFRRHWHFTAYGEGWALYAERLGNEIGMYEDPYDKFGNLGMELLRATRLVVDTGLHAEGWSREQAIEYMKQHSTESEAFVIAEVDRYITGPAQATAYKIGELKIIELRARAKAALGDRFDLRAFHNAVIDSGSMPLSVLEQIIDAWIAAEKKRGGAVKTTVRR